MTQRALALGTVMALGFGAMARDGVPGPDAAAAAGAAPKVVEADKLADTLYVLKGGGGNTALFLTAAGAVVVDTKLPGWGQPLLDKIKTLTDKPVTMVINTHTHYDHTNGQVEFPASVEVVAHANTKTLHGAGQPGLRAAERPAAEHLQGARRPRHAGAHVHRPADAGTAAPTRSTSTTSGGPTPAATPTSCSRRSA